MNVRINLNGRESKKNPPVASHRFPRTLIQYPYYTQLKSHGTHFSFILYMLHKKKAMQGILFILSGHFRVSIEMNFYRFIFVVCLYSKMYSRPLVSLYANEVP